jgi:hypothetical protein
LCRTVCAAADRALEFVHSGECDEHFAPRELRETTAKKLIAQFLLAAADSQSALIDFCVEIGYFLWHFWFLKDIVFSKNLWGIFCRRLCLVEVNASCRRRTLWTTV